MLKPKLVPPDLINLENPVKQTIEERVMTVIALQDPDGDITPTSTLRDDLDFDSLDIVEMTMGLEEEFDLDIRDDDAEKWLTVQDVLTYIKRCS